MELYSENMLEALKATANKLQGENTIEILLIGGAAGMLTGQLPADRVTLDCDIMHCKPKQAEKYLLAAAHKVAKEQVLPENWLNCQAMQLNVLPDGWQSRRIFVAEFEPVKIFAASRLDLLAMKCYANRPQDQQDIFYLRPTPEELDYIRKYLNMLRVPSRQAHLDQVVSALQLVDAIEEQARES